jgi:hypothetical protein
MAFSLCTQINGTREVEDCDEMHALGVGGESGEDMAEGEGFRSGEAGRMRICCAGVAAVVGWEEAAKKPREGSSLRTR